MSAELPGTPQRSSGATASTSAPSPTNDMTSQVFIRDPAIGFAAMAAADAKHDLESAFTDIFGEFREIGCPVIPNTLRNEISTLNTILKFQDERASVTSAPKAYKSKYLNDSNVGGQKNGTFKVFTNGPVYNWKSWFVGTRTPDAKDVEWAKPGMSTFDESSGSVAVNARSLFDWLDVKGTNNIAFTVDATSVPFCRVFQDSGRWFGSAEKKAYNILTREGVSDSAGKGPLKAYSGSVVEIIDLYDYGEKGVPAGKFYLSTPPLDRDTKDDPNDCFFSKFDISVSAISKQNNLNCIAMEFTTPGFVKHINTLKGSKEEAHSGTKGAVVDQIRGFLAKLGLANIFDKNNYFTQLQQKRSGDWLQVLACHDMGRFRLLGLPANCNEIFLVTHDQICLAYALAMGINILYAQYNETDKKYWLTFFSKETRVADPRVVLKDYINEIRASHRDETYIEKRDAYISKQHEIYGALVTKLHISMTLDPSNIEDLERKLKTILENAVDIAYFLQTMPLLENETIVNNFHTHYILPDEPVTQLMNIFPSTTADNVNKIIAEIYGEAGKFKRNTAKIDKHPDLKRTNNIFLGASDKIRKNFLKDTRVEITHIQIRQRLFSRLIDPAANDRRRGVGVFSFLNTILTGAAKVEIEGVSLSPIQLIRRWLLNVNTPFIKAASDDDKFWGALKAIAFLTLGDDNLAGSAADATAAAAAVAQVVESVEMAPTAALLTTVDDAKDVTIDKLSAHISEQIVDVTEPDPAAPAVPETATTQDKPDPEETYVQKMEVLLEAARTAAAAAAAAATRSARRGAAAAEAAEAALEKANQILSNRQKAYDRAVRIAGRVVAIHNRETSVFVVSDFQPAIMVASARAQKSFWGYIFGGGHTNPPALASAIDANERNVMINGSAAFVAEAARQATRRAEAAAAATTRRGARGGGGYSAHNPHTTFFFLLRELGFRLTLDYLDHHEAVYTIGYFIMNIYKNIDAAVDKGLSERKYLTMLEFFVLTKMRDANPDFYDIITDVTRNYFGFDSIPESYNVTYTIPADIQAVLFESSPYDPEQRLNYVPFIDSLMDTIIERCAAMEEQEQQGNLQYTLTNRVPSMIQTPYLPEAIAVGGRRTYKRKDNKHNKHNKDNKHKQRRTIRRKQKRSKRF